MTAFGIIVILICLVTMATTRTLGSGEYADLRRRLTDIEAQGSINTKKLNEIAACLGLQDDDLTTTHPVYRCDFEEDLEEGTM